MTVGMKRTDDEATVIRLSDAEVERAIDEVLAQLKLTPRQLVQHAAKQDFASPLAHKLWIAYGDRIQARARGQGLRGPASTHPEQDSL